jgi:hypothetical protein
MGLSFERDIRPLFRESDRRAMEWLFDLWSYSEVQGNASLILERVRGGTMPCDRSWSDAEVEKLSDWIDAGMAP